MRSSGRSTGSTRPSCRRSMTIGWRGSRSTAQVYDRLTDATADRFRQDVPRPRSAPAGGQGEVLRPAQDGHLAEDRRPLPPGREPDPAAARSADRFVAADRRVEITEHFMRTRTIIVSSVALLMASAAIASADQVKLRNGQAVTGSFMSADAKMVRMLLANGKIAEFPVDNHQRRRILGTQDRAAAGAGSGESAETDHAAEGHGADRRADAGDRRRRDAGRPDLQGGARRSGDDGWQGHRAARRGRSSFRSRRSNRPAR